MFKSDSRFLIIDDSKIIRELIREALVQLNFRHIEEADNGKRGWEKIERLIEGRMSYTLVFCDINMPKMDGLELLEKVRADQRTSHIPVLMTTTENNKQIVIKAISSGVCGYMVKPFGVHDVKKKLQEISDRLNSTQQNTAK